MTLRPLLFIALLCFSPALKAEDTNQIRQILEERNKEFDKEVIRVSESVYTAVGYGLAPVSMIVGEDGIVVVDTNLDLPSGKAVIEQFRKITDLPVKAIIFTHGHGDHTGGAAAFVEDGTQIWARANFNTDDLKFADAGLKMVFLRRGFRQFGVMTPEDGINHVGVTPRYIPPRDTASIGPNNPIRPTRVFSGESTVFEAAGLEISLVAASGETSDQLFVWFEKEKVIFSGDNFYKSWPNLYAIRGTTYRDVNAWVDSLSAMIEHNPHHLVGGHTRPIVGQAQTKEVLTNYRDAVKYVFEKTIEGIEKGLTPDELIEYAQLPQKYRDLDYLRPYYGHPDWGVRSIFNGYLGWFDGNPTNLFPIPSVEEAAQMVELAGGEEAVRAAMVKAQAEDNYQWALQLSDYLLRLNPDDRALMMMRAEFLDARAEQVFNVTARNYYRTAAFELRQKASAQNTPE